MRERPPYPEARKAIENYLKAQKMGGVLALPKKSPQIAKQTGIKPQIVSAVLSQLRNEGLVDFDYTHGWRWR